MSAHVVLVVEDEAESRDSLRELLELEGYEVRTAANGLEALDALAALRRPCIILLDLMMPVMDGLELLDRMRAAGGLDERKVLITTSAPERAPPGIAVLRKPLRVDKLLPAVARLCAA